MKTGTPRVQGRQHRDPAAFAARSTSTDQSTAIDGGTGFRVWISDKYAINRRRELHIPEWCEIEVDGDNDCPGWRARVEVCDGAPRCTRFEFYSGANDREIRQTDFRTVQLSAIVEYFTAAWAVRIVRDERGHVVAAEPALPNTKAHVEAVKTIQKARTTMRPRKITPELLSEVAEVYRANVSNNPTQRVRETFNVGERMASGYVQRARAAGLLPQTTPGKKKG